MRIHKTSHVKTVKSEANRWTHKDVFTLQLLAGTHTYEEIAVVLGRSPNAVQVKASRMGLQVRSGALAEAASAKADQQLANTQRLKASEAELSEFLVECDENPADVRPGSRTYHKDYKRAQRAQQSKGDSE